MNPYKRLYYLLFNAITDALNVLNAGRFDSCAAILKQAQVMAEEIYISSDLPDESMNKH